MILITLDPETSSKNEEITRNNRMNMMTGLDTFAQRMSGDVQGLATEEKEDPVGKGHVTSTWRNPHV